MTFAQPLALALAALAVPVILAYLYRLHRIKRPIASTILMRVIRDEQPTAQKSKSKLRHRISLALVLAALLATVLALAGPDMGAESGRRVVIVLDTSASMAAREASGTDRLTAAVDEVSDIVASAGEADEIALVVAGGTAGVAMPPTKNHADIVARARSAAARGAGGDNRDDAMAFRLADGLCRDPARTTIVVVSDGAGLSAPKTACPLRHVSVGGAASNVGIAALSVRAADGLGLVDVHLAVASSASEKKQVEVTLTSEAGIVDVVSLEVPPKGEVERTVRVVIEGGQTLTATLSGGDALVLDDRAVVPLPDHGPVKVLLVTARPKSLLAEVLKLHPRVTLSVAAPGQMLAKEAFDLAVLENDPQGELGTVPKVVAFGVVPSGSPITLGAPAANKSIVRWDFSAPWFRYVDLREVAVGGGHNLVGGTSVVDSGSGPLVATAPWGERELVVAGFTVEQTDLTLRAAFPNLVANRVDWATPPVQAARPNESGVLSAAESRLAGAAGLPGDELAAGTRWSDTRGLVRLALIAAILLLLAEQIVSAVLRGRRTA